jgi:hypothetical protein
MSAFMFRTGRMTIVAVATVVALAPGLAACGDDDGDTSTESGSGSTEGGSDGAGDGSAVTIVSPADGDAIEPDFDLELDSSEEIGEPDTGNFHFHVFVDGDQEDYEIVYDNSHRVERDLAEGEHTIEVALANPDHSLVGDDARDEITVTVGGAAGGSGGSDTTGTTAGEDDGGGGY